MGPEVALNWKIFLSTFSTRQADNAQALVQRARAVGVQADEVTVGTLLKALAAEGRADEAFSVYTQVSTVPLALLTSLSSESAR